MTANRAVTGTFVAARTLSVSASGNGGGRIVSTTPPGLSCVNNCSVTQRFTLNTSVVLTPQPAASTSFRWTGGNCTGSGGCTTVMSVNRSAVGQFTLNRFSLSVTARASGKVVNSSALPGGVSISCGSGATACGGAFDYGTPVSLRATPNAGFVFTSWSGTACVGSTNPSCSFTLRANTTATPNFRARTLVTIVKSGTGSGTVTGPGISCGLDCSRPEFDRAAVLLTATAATRLAVPGLQRRLRVQHLDLQLRAGGDSQSVVATFQITQRRRTLSVVGGGTVTGAGASCTAAGPPCVRDFNYGTVLTLTPTPAPGFRSVGWSQDCAGTGACNPTMTANRAVAATFRP